MQHIFTLPSGYIDSQGKLHKQIALKPLGGYEEELLMSSCQQVSAKLVSEVLSRCIVKIGDIANVDESISRSLLIEDRLFILLKLRFITFGDFIQAVINCPAKNCNEKIDIDFNISDIQFEERKSPQKYYQFQLSENAAEQCGTDDRQINFRLPDGGDQENASNLAINNPAEVLSFLLSRCIKNIFGKDTVTIGDVKALPALVRLEIEHEIEKHAGDSDLSMTTQCPHCQLSFEVPFDIHDFFFDELKISQERLYREVHYLAYHYHWSEREIMSMSKVKRRQYVEMLADEIERLNDAA